jgi:catechol 2,3-dioxygenase-like lactoylglutathione lyase family enzyme
MPIVGIDHVQLAMPEGCEDAARRFYAGLLGLPETPKPERPAARGGAWFELGAVKLHLGVESDFRPARKAHPAFVVDDIDDLAERLRVGGHEVRWDDAIPGLRRLHTDDPVGNRLEFVQV